MYAFFSSSFFRLSARLPNYLALTKKQNKKKKQQHFSYIMLIICVSFPWFFYQKITISTSAVVSWVNLCRPTSSLFLLFFILELKNYFYFIVFCFIFLCIFCVFIGMLITQIHLFCSSRYEKVWRILIRQIEAIHPVI